MKEQITLVKCDNCGNVIDIHKPYIQLQGVYKGEDGYNKPRETAMRLVRIGGDSSFFDQPVVEFENSDFCCDECALDFLKGKLARLSY